MIVSDEAACQSGGEAFLNRLRMDEKEPTLPVILILDHVTPDLLRRHKRDEAVWFLEKDNPEGDVAQVARQLMSL